MEKIERWLRSQRRWEANRPGLEMALMGSRFGTYSSYRLRYLLIRLVFRCVLLLAETWFFLGIMAAVSDFLLIIALRHVMWLSATLIWGGLEPLRNDIRQVAKASIWSARTRQRLALMTTTALFRATCGGVGLILVTALGLGLVFAAGYISGLAALCILAVAVRIGVNLPLRTYHAGIYALRRVYYPVWLLLLVDTLDILLVLVLWPLLGLAALPCAILIGCAVSSVATMVMCRDAYRAKQINPPRLVFVPGRPAPAGSFSRQKLTTILRFAFANALTEVDSVLVLLVAGMAVTRPDMLAFLSVLHVVYPFTQATQQWSRLFYFDFMRLQLGAGSALRRQFETRLKHTALVFSLLLWAAAGLCALLVSPSSDTLLFVAVLAPFFVSRAQLALRQIRAFSYYDFSGLLRIAALLVVGGTLIAATTESLPLGLLLLAILFMLAGRRTALNQSVGADHRQCSTKTLPQWLASLATVQQAVIISGARFHSQVEPAAVIAAAQKLGQLLDRGSLCTLNANALAWFEPAGGKPQITPQVIVQSGLGAAVSIFEPLHFTSGQQALADTAVRGMLGLATDHASAGASPQRADICAHFRRIFPSGCIYDLQRWKLEAPATLTPEKERALLRSALCSQYLGGAGSETGCFHAVTALCIGGEPSLLFLVEPWLTARSRTWQAYLTSIHIGQAAHQP